MKMNKLKYKKKLCYILEFYIYITFLNDWKLIKNIGTFFVVKYFMIFNTYFGKNNNINIYIFWLFYYIKISALVIMLMSILGIINYYIII